MRLGKPDRKKRGEVKQTAGLKTKPKYCSSNSVVGELSPDFIGTYFAPELIRLATQSLEQYAGDLLEYEDHLAEYNKLTNGTDEAQVDADGSTIDLSAPPQPPVPPIYRSQYWVEELKETISETTEHFQGKQSGWKVHANAAKFERHLDEKYGMLRPFITSHPEVEQFVRSVQRKYASGYFSPFRQGKPPIPRSTAVIILFMMQRGKMRWEVLTLATLFFLIGLQPWALVVLVAGWHTILETRRRKPLSPMKSYVPLVDSYYETEEAVDDADSRQKAKYAALNRPVGTPLKAFGALDTEDYDAIIIGSGPAPLFTASLLSRAGRKVLVLSPRSDASGCFNISDGSQAAMNKYGNIAFDVESSNISKISKQQKLLAAALCTNTDYQGGVRFAKIGTPSDGYAFEILSIPGMGTDGGEEIPFIVRADGAKSLMEDAAQFLGDGWPGIHGEVGNSTTGSYLTAVEGINNTSNEFYLSKILADNVNNMRSSGSYSNCAIRLASSFLDKCFPMNAHTRSLMAAIGMKGENLKPSQTSMGAHVTNISSAMSGEGMHYPIGGPRALCHALANVVTRSGGQVVTEVAVAQLMFEPTDPSVKPVLDKEGQPKEGAAPRCIGVQLADGKELKFDMNRFKSGHTKPAIISMHSLITTFIRLLPEQIRTTYKVPRGLPALSERRPVFKILFALDGSAEDLEVTGADYYRLPSAALARDEIDENNAIRLGEIGWNSEDTDSAEVTVEQVNKDEGDAGNPQAATARDKRRRNKFDTGLSYLQISFPSAKDPSFESRCGKVSSCVVTIEADDDFVTPFDTKPKLYAIQKDKGVNSGEYQRLMERVKRDLLNIYPQLQDKIEHAQLIGPLHRGLSHTPERYAAKGVRADSPYPGLFVGGSDLTVGESMSGALVGGWLTANAVAGYSAVDHLFLNKNISTDLQEYLDIPDIPDEGDDVAVPYQPKIPTVEVENAI